MIESEVSEEVSDENTEPSRKIQTNGDFQMSTAEIDEITTKTETKNNKDNTKCAAQVFGRNGCKNVISLTEYSVKSSNTVNTR